MKTPRTLLVLAVLLLLPAFMFSPRLAHAGFDPEKVARQIRQAIVTQDTAMLSRHLKQASYFIDEPYTKSELLELLTFENSWLSRNLFTAEDSLKTYFETAQDLKIVVTPAKDEYILSYRSSNYPPHEWPWCSVKPRGKSWVFADMFAYR